MGDTLKSQDLPVSQTIAVTKASVHKQNAAISIT